MVVEVALWARGETEGVEVALGQWVTGEVVAAGTSRRRAHSAVVA